MSFNSIPPQVLCLFSVASTSSSSSSSSSSSTTEAPSEDEVELARSILRSVQLSTNPVPTTSQKRVQDALSMLEAAKRCGWKEGREIESKSNITLSSSKSRRIRASSDGRVQRYFNGRWKDIGVAKDGEGYWISHGMTGTNYSKYIHRIVARIWWGEGQEGETVDHENRIRDDNRPINLSWKSKSEQANNRIMVKPHRNSQSTSIPIKCVYVLDRKQYEQQYKSKGEATRAMGINDIQVSRSVKKNREVEAYVSSNDGAGAVVKRTVKAQFSCNSSEVEDKAGEEWKPVNTADAKTHYVSNLGRIKIILADKRGEMLIHEDESTKESEKAATSHGYYSCNYVVGKDTEVYLHRVVAALFKPKSEEDMKKGRNIVDHINSVKTDNRAVNLKWTTAAENQWINKQKGEKAAAVAATAGEK